LKRTINGAVRFVDEARQHLGMPMVAPGLFLIAVHALLDHRPSAVVGDEETVQVEIEAILDGCAIDLGDKTARARQGGPVEPYTVTQRVKFVRSFPRMLAATAADVDTEFVLQRAQAALQSTDDAGRDPRRMPVHSHHGTEGLEPERMRQPPQKFVATVMVDNRLGDDRAER
jgi:hypothetical protein